MLIVIILLVVLAAAVFWYVVTYNSLVRLRTESQEAWSQIDVQLQRRNDLIPNLIQMSVIPVTLVMGRIGLSLNKKI